MTAEVAVYDTKSYDKEYLSKAAGAESITWRFHEFRLNEETASTSKGATVVCPFVNDQLDQVCIEKIAEIGVKLIALRCAGYNNVDLKTAKACGLSVTRVPAYSPHAVAEHAVALLLTLNRRIHRAYNRVREHNFALGGLVGFDLNGKTVGVIGTGKIGKIAAQIFRGFDMRVLAYDPYPAEKWATDYRIEYTDLSTLLAQSDVISLHVPLLRDNVHMINSETIRKMKPGVYLINTSRGKLIDTTALIEGLKDGRLGGVALDVYEEEEGIFFEDHSDSVLQDDELSRLLTFPNVLITSHQAFLTKEALSEIARVTVENIHRLTTNQEFLPDTKVA